MRRRCGPETESRQGTVPFKCGEDQAAPPLLLVLGVRMLLVRETVHPILAAQVAFAVLAIVVEGGMLSNLNELREKGVLYILIHFRWLGNAREHLRGRDRRTCQVDNLNEV